MAADWICCQLGAREHYAVPRALSRAGRLVCLVTEVWVRPGSPWRWLPGRRASRWRERFHPELAQAPVRAFNFPSLVFEPTHCLWPGGTWARLMARNRWFQRKAVDCLQRLDLRLSTPDSRPTLFAYSYAALGPFRFAQSQGWRAVLGQIDPGPVEAEIVGAEHDRHPELKTRWQPPPDGYWRAWREECALADWIVVNSEWSREALCREGVPKQKLRVIPLAYEAPLTERRPERQYPARFSPERPLRVLFLGQIILRKGVAQVLRAAELLQKAPVEFWMVGPSDVVSLAERTSGGNLRWFGPVPRGEAGRFYEEADVLLFPTLSDGFGLTQLEAQAHRLPVIASRHCGAVVQHGVNGSVLPEVSAAAIVKALSACLESPANLREWARASAVAEEFGLGRVGQRLLSMTGDGRDELPVP